jgi:hypothetical protein
VIRHRLSGGHLKASASDMSSPQRNVELFYVKPEEILRFVITELSPSVILRHGTIKEDFFLSIYSP